MASGRLLDIREMHSSRLHSFCHSVLTPLLDAISNPSGVGMKGKNLEKEAKIVPPWLVLFNMQASCILCLDILSCGFSCRVLRGFLEDDLLVSWGLWFPWCEWCSDAFQLPLAFASRIHFRFSSSDDRRLASWAGVILKDLQAYVPFAGVNSSLWNSCTLTRLFPVGGAVTVQLQLPTLLPRTLCLLRAWSHLCLPPMWEYVWSLLSVPV